MDYIARDAPRPLIDEGDYDAVYIRDEEAFVFGTKKLFLYFKIITPGPQMGVEIYMPFNMNYKGLIAAGSKYYRCWCLANNWQQPSRNAKMSPNIFKNKFFRVRIRNVKAGFDKTEMPQHLFYSIIDSILSSENEPV